MLTNLFRGLPGLTSAHVAAIIDVVPYDGSLPRAVMEAARHQLGLPVMRCGSIVWTGTLPNRSIIESFLSTDTRNHMYQLSKDSKYNVPGMGNLPSTPVDEGQQPTLREEHYKLTKPQNDLTLPLRQSVLDEWEAEERVEYRNSVRQLVQEHDKEWNPSGVPWKLKRPLEEDSQSNVEAAAVTLPGASETKESLLAEEGAEVHTVMGAEPFYELVASKGRLFVFALADGVISDQQPVCGLGAGEYYVGDDAKKVMSAGSALNKLVVGSAYPFAAQVAAFQREACWLPLTAFSACVPNARFGQLVRLRD